MKKMAMVGLVLVLVVAGGLVLRTTTCSSWQEDYKRFMYSEMLKNSPVTHTPQDIEQLIGTKPSSCTHPTSLSDGDIATFRQENVGPNHFVDEMREARQRSST